MFITYNSGDNWSHIKLSDNSLNDIFFFENTGFIVGDNGTIFKKEEDQNWVEQSSRTNNKLNAVYFIDADTGYAFGDNSTIIKTTNGGDNWEKLVIIQRLTITDGAFPKPEYGVCTSMEGILISTQDYGRSWQYLNFPEDNLFYSIFFPDTAVAYITAWGGDLDYILKLTNRADEWEIKWPTTLSNINSSFFLNANTGYIVGSNGSMSKTTDGGNTWNHQKSLTNKNLYDVFFLNEEYGYVCGDDKTIIKTTDGGLTWDIQSSGNSTDLWDIYFTNENIGYIAGEIDYIFKTTDAGNSWNISDSIFDGWLSSVYFINSDTGFCVSMFGNLFTTTDGGIT